MVTPPKGRGYPKGLGQVLTKNLKKFDFLNFPAVFYDITKTFYFFFDTLLFFRFRFPPQPCGGKTTGLFFDITKLFYFVWFRNVSEINKINLRSGGLRSEDLKFRPPDLRLIFLISQTFRNHTKENSLRNRSRKRGGELVATVFTCHAPNFLRLDLTPVLQG